jgi:hypothetical protein
MKEKIRMVWTRGQGCVAGWTDRELWAGIEFRELPDGNRDDIRRFHRLVVAMDDVRCLGIRRRYSW